MEIKTDFHLDRVYGYLRILLALSVLAISFFYVSGAMDYRANPSRIYVDMMGRPIAEQNLLGFAEHNEGYGKGRDSVTSFGREAILTLFNYHFSDFVSGAHKQKTLPFFSAQSFDEIYGLFQSLTFNRVVEAQEGIVESDVVGEISYIGSTTSLRYQGSSNETVSSFKVNGTLVVEVNADTSEKEVYKFELYIQRAPIQDKVRGYQVVQLEISS